MRSHKLLDVEGECVAHVTKAWAEKQYAAGNVRWVGSRTVQFLKPRPTKTEESEATGLAKYALRPAESVNVRVRTILQYVVGHLPARHIGEAYRSKLSDRIVSKFSGADATPGRAVLYLPDGEQE